MSAMSAPHHEIRDRARRRCAGRMPGKWDNLLWSPLAFDGLFVDDVSDGLAGLRAMTATDCPSRRPPSD